MRLHEDLIKAMETGDHFKNGASSKSHRSRENKIQRAYHLLSFFFISMSCAFAQDIITLKNATDIEAIVQEVGEAEIKYKKFENPNGPNYTLKKSEVFTIRYANGSKDVFVDAPVPETGPNSMPESITNSQIVQRQSNPSEPLAIQNLKIYNNYGVRLSRTEIENVMRSVPEALALYNSGKRRRGAGLGFMIPGLITCGLSFAFQIDGKQNYDQDTYDLGVALGVVSIGLNITSFCLSSSGYKRIRNSVGVYNRGIKPSTTDASLKFGITQSGGIGIALNF